MNDARGTRRPAGASALLLLLCLACKPSETRAPAAKGGAPQMQATVVRIETRSGNAISSHQLVIANGKARSTNEVDTWRLFDTNAKTVTFVDDIDRTIRTESLDALLRARRAAFAATLPAHYPRAKVETTNSRRAILNVATQQTVVTVGAYRRELWLGEHGAIPRGLFALMQASEERSSPLAPMMREADDVLTRATGFPLVDRAEIAGQFQIEEAVVSVAQGSVPAAMLDVPRGYKDLTPKPPPAKR